MNRRKFLSTASTAASWAALSGCGGGAAAEAEPASPAPPAPTPVPAPAPAPSAPAPSPPASRVLPAWVRGLALWQWHEIPETRLSSVDPAVRSLGITGPRSKVDAWCGACLKRDGSVYLLGAAGGHADYAGNEVNALRLNVDAPRWEELRGPTPNHQVVDATQFYLDLRPAATHTYYATQFIDSLNRMVVLASPGLSGTIFPAAPGGFAYAGDTRSFSFNLASGDWDPPDYMAPYTHGGDFTAALCVKHPHTSDVYYSRGYGGGWYRWSPGLNQWSRLSATTRAPWYAGAAIDPIRQRMLVVGGYSPIAPVVLSLDGVAIAASFSGLGADSLRLTGYPGVVYDESLDAYLVLHNGPAGQVELLRVDAATWAVDQPAVSGTVPANRSNGVLNAVQYAPELDGIVFVNRHDGNAWFMRTSG